MECRMHTQSRSTDTIFITAQSFSMHASAARTANEAYRRSISLPHLEDRRKKTTQETVTVILCSTVRANVRRHRWLSPVKGEA